MNNYIRSATWIPYNANARGNRSPDCVKRALSLGLDMSYNEVSKLLIAKMKEKRADAWNNSFVFYPVMLENGCTSWTTDGLDINESVSSTTLDEFVDNIADPSKVYIVETGKRGDIPDHLVCVRDGKIWDSWDSRNQYVVRYSIATGNHKQVQREAFDVEDFKKLTNLYIEPTVCDTMDTYMDRKNIEFSTYDVETSAKGLKMTTQCSLLLSATDWIDQKRQYDFKIDFVLTPTMTDEEIADYLKSTAKTRTYDRMYTIYQQEQSLKESEEMARLKGDKRFKSYPYYMNGLTKKFYNSLPGWVKPLVTYIYVQSPGQYSDSYQLEIEPIPGRNSSSKLIKFDAYESSDIRDMLDRYKNSDELPGRDYDTYEEY